MHRNDRHSSAWLLGMVALLAGALSAGAVSCVFKFDTTNCDDYPAKGCPGVGTGTGGNGTGGNGTTSSSSSGGGGSGGSTPASCIPSEDPKNAVDDTCGVFVSATGSDTGNGTKNAPFQTFAAAVTKAQAQNKPIYACAEGFTEKVSLPAGIEVYGGLDCGTMPRKWTYIGDMQKTVITAMAGEIPLTLEKGTGTKIADLNVKSASAVNPGESSIAVVADKVTADITRCVFEAGAGADGAPGQNFSSAAQGGTTGEKGGDACSSAVVNGGLPAMSGCGTPDSVSGLGGQGLAASAGPGGPGTPGGTPNGGDADTGGGCTAGKTGATGTVGGPGAGATGLGAITNKGFAGVTGSDGKAGGPGQGGGGGGGRIGGSGTGKCASAASAGGAAGGSGGSGGCGGSGGKGGGPAGSSIALVSVDSKLTFTTVTLIAAAGGKGGSGGNGQTGGAGGMPGAGGAGMNNLLGGCSGGLGGVGGDGGKGGGGTGGHSIGIAYTGTMPVASSADTWMATPSTAGDGGLGDTSNGNPGNGAAGTAAPMAAFP